MFYERLKLLCDKHDIKISTFTTNVLKMSKGNTTNWKNGKEPSLDVLNKCADYFDVSTDYLLGKTDTPTPRETHPVLQKYNSLDEHGKEVVESVLDIEYERVQSEKQKSKIIELNLLNQDAEPEKELPEYDLPISAGTGEFLDSDRYEMVTYINVPRGASFAVRVSGDSMEPDYSDGDKVFVRLQPYVDSGEIGVFVLNGEGYIKKLISENGTCRLVSSNPKYLPIVLKEYDEFRVVGKVLGIAKEKFD